MISEKILNSINECLKKSIISEEIPAGLYSGYSGVLLYNRYYHLYTNGSDFLSESELDLLVSNSIDNTTLSPLFSTGISGNLWAFFNLYKNNLIEADIEEFMSYKEFLITELFKYAENNSWDNLHGAFGILFFLVEAELIEENLFLDFLNIIEKKMFRNSEFIFYTSPMTQQNQDEKCYNLSLSHGLSGHILILTQALKLFPNNKILKTLLNKMVGFLLKYKLETPLKGFFPQILPEDLNDKLKFNYKQIRLAWCYGDIGPGFALYRYSDLMKDEELKNKALKVLLNASKVTNVTESHVCDAGLCHGMAGLMHVFNKLHIETGILDFEVASNYWANTLNELFLKEGLDGLSSNLYNRQADTVLSPSFLEGISGIGLAVMAKTHPGLNHNWDKCLLIS